MTILSRSAFRTLSLITVGGLVAPSYASAQSEVAFLYGDEFFDLFGLDAAAVGDVNADGIPDFAVGGYRGTTGRGRINVYSGDDGSMIHNIFGLPGESLGFVVPIGDVNGDGFDDFGGNGLNAGGWIFSGLDGSILQAFPGAIQGGVGDFDGDGRADYIANSSIISGATGQSLFQLATPSSQYEFIGDVTGDGVSDYVNLLYQPNLSSARYQTFSGSDNALLYESTMPWGTEAVGLGDMNADGLNDWGFTWRTSFSGELRVEVVSGVDGAPILELCGLGIFTQALFRPLAAGGDADGDGYGDLLMTTEPPRLFSGRTGGVLAQFVRVDGTRTARIAASMDDANGDGRREFVVGSPNTPGGPQNAGTAALFSYDGPVGQSYCLSLPNSTGQAAVITASGSSSLAANNLLLATHNAPASSIGIFLLGAGQQQVALGDGFLCVGAGGAGVVRLPAQPIDANGLLVLEFDHTALPAAAGTLIAGSTRNFQGWFRDVTPLGAQSNLTDAVSVTFTP